MHPHYILRSTKRLVGRLGRIDISFAVSRGRKVVGGSRRIIVFSNFAGLEQRRALNLGIKGTRLRGKGNFHQRVEGEKASVFKPRVINDASQLVAARGS